MPEALFYVCRQATCKALDEQAGKASKHLLSQSQAKSRQPAQPASRAMGIGPQQVTAFLLACRPAVKAVCEVRACVVLQWTCAWHVWCRPGRLHDHSLNSLGQDKQLRYVR